jgi:membrane-associated protein
MPLGTELAAHPGWAYLLIALLVALDAVLPLVPGEAAVLAGAALAARGDLALAGVFAATAAGAFAGDLTGYGAGRLLGGRLAHRRRPARWLARARGWLDRRGARVLVVARFVPGGRTAGALAAGVLRVPPRRFAGCVALGAVLWTAYLGGVGYAGGRLVDVPPLLLAGALTVAVTLAGLLAARLRARRATRLHAPRLIRHATRPTRLSATRLVGTRLVATRRSAGRLLAAPRPDPAGRYAYTCR